MMCRPARTPNIFGYSRLAATVPARFFLLYDGDCGVCAFFARLVHRADLRRQIGLVPLATPAADPWFAGVSQEERFGSAHVVWPSGIRVSGGRALIALLAALPLGAGAARMALGMPVAARGADSVYRALVRYREFLASQPTGAAGTSAV